MQLSDLDYEFPPGLIAVEPARPTRVAFTAAGRSPAELTIDDLLAKFGPHDLFVINESKVVPARVFSREEAEILFLKPNGEREWEVLFPSREYKAGDVLNLPDGVQATLTRKGLPQILRVSRELDAAYFEKHGEMALPPYIQEARAERHNRSTDQQWYQTAWARTPGSVAAPTASLHFTEEDLAKLDNVACVTLHVGAGTFFPVRTENLSEHKMHAEYVEIPAGVRYQMNETRARGGKIWALGTTVARSLESLGTLTESAGRFTGETSLFIYPPYTFKNVDVLLTNFHQPRSTLLALVAAFAGLDTVKSTYKWAVANEFKLFSYGDLSAWTKP
jgi:S-adenosylmethionine:tRNA ribosyltransferase-isomerase